MTPSLKESSFLEKEPKTTEIPHYSFFRKKKQKTAAETPIKNNRHDDFDFLPSASLH